MSVITDLEKAHDILDRAGIPRENTSGTVVYPVSKRVALLWLRAIKAEKKLIKEKRDAE